MRIAILSDLHANYQATEAVSKDLDGSGANAIWCLGDVVGYGANPSEVLAWVTKRAQVIVKGNHDEAVATGDVDGFNPVAAAAARYHAQVLTPTERTQLHDLPLNARRPLEGATDVGGTPTRGSHSPMGEDADAPQRVEHPKPRPQALLVHASPDDPLREYVYPTSARRDLARWTGMADIILLGHTHVPFAARLGKPDATPHVGGGWHIEGFEQVIDVDARVGEAHLLIVNPGSVGQPRDGDPRASYAILDTDARRVELRRVPYDVGAAAAAIREARLDAFLGQRLYRGI